MTTVYSVEFDLGDGVSLLGLFEDQGDATARRESLANSWVESGQSTYPALADTLTVVARDITPRSDNG